MYKKIAITNRKMTDDLLVQLEKITSSSDVDIVILREKDLDENEYRTLAIKAKEICEKNGKELILHTFYRVSLELGLGVHLTMKDFISLDSQVKSKLKKIGVSTHTVEEAVESEEKGADYITASHIFATDCKKGLRPKGLMYLREVKESVGIEVYALGGIHPDNIFECVNAGADGICMMSEYMKINA